MKNGLDCLLDVKTLCLFVMKLKIHLEGFLGCYFPLYLITIDNLDQFFIFKKKLVESQNAASVVEHYCFI